MKPIPLAKLKLALPLLAALPWLMRLSWFEPWILTDHPPLGTSSAPWVLQFRFEKLIALFGLLLWSTPQVSPLLRSSIQNQITPTKKFRLGQARWILAGSAVLVGPALLSGYVRWDPKGSSDLILMLPFTLHQLISVCFLEEAFFRIYLPKLLHNLIPTSFLLPNGNFDSSPTSTLQAHLRYCKQPEIFLSSIVFGLTHFHSGIALICLATLAGFIYSLAAREGGLRAAVLTHWGVNAIHFWFFTYPRS